jgi:hypothetical protein
MGSESIMKKLFIYVLIALLGAGFYYYYSLGGFNKPVISQVQTSSYFIAGKYYEGKINSKELGRLFERTEEMVNQGSLPGEHAALFYSDPDKNDGQVKAIVGALVNDTTVSLPDSFEIRKIEAQQVVRGSLEAHYTVAPVGIYQEIRKYANENNFTLSDTTLEIYHTRDSLTVEVPVTGTLNNK